MACNYWNLEEQLPLNHNGRKVRYEKYKMCVEMKKLTRYQYYIYNRNVTENNIQTVDEQDGYTTN